MENLNDNLKVTYWGLAVNLLLGFTKCLTGGFFHSRALIMDGLHSLLDLSTDLAVILGLKMSSKPEDANHPYGHHKFASLANLFISLMLIGFCVTIIVSGILSLREGIGHTPGWPAFYVAVFSLLIKEGLFYWTRAVAKKKHSRLLLANAWHHRSDSLSSLVVILAILGARILGPGWWLLDFAASIILGGFLLFAGMRLMIRACNDLLDTAPERMIINDLREHILPTPGAVGYHNFRARWVGDRIEVDLHLQVDPSLPIEDGHEIAREVRDNILRRHPEVVSVLVHIEPATDPHIKEQGVFDFHKDGGNAGERRE